MSAVKTVESQCLAAAAGTPDEWSLHQPLLSERPWATVREDDSEKSDGWRYFPHDHACSRVERSGRGWAVWHQPTA